MKRAVLVHAAILDHTVRGVLSPPHTLGRRDQQLGTVPVADFECAASTQDMRIPTSER
jgi:hypothetical protein